MTDKAKAILAWLFSWVGGLIFLLSKDSSANVKLHAAQSIVAGVGYFGVSAVYGFIPIRIPFFSTALSILYMVCWIMGIVKAAQEQDPELPIIGGFAKSIFAKQLGE